MPVQATTPALSALVARFWSKVAPSFDDECWPWKGACHPKFGYGHFGTLSRRIEGAHRVSWALHFGPIPAGLCVLHRCDNPPCVNPAHLFLGTHGDNAADKVAKGRQTMGAKNPRAKLTETDVREIRAAVAGGQSLGSAARGYGVTHTTVRAIMRRRLWKHTA